MKNLLKVFSVLIILLFLLSGTLTATHLTPINSVNYGENSEYKTRGINIFGLPFKYNDKIFFNGENNQITTEEKQTNNVIVICFSVVLILYWLTLLFLYEKEEYHDYTYENKDDLETLKKYNPMIAGCLVDNRDILPRDITAVILNLIQKDVISMKMIPAMEGKEDYRYIISENKKNMSNLDEIERYILNWIFGFYEQDEIELIPKLKELSRRKDFLKHMKHLNKLAQKKLHSIGANINKVPFSLRIVNVLLVIFSIVFASIHIVNNGISIHIYQTTILLSLLIIGCILLILPVIALIIHLIMVLVVAIKRIIKSSSEKYSGKQIVQTSSLILISMLFFIVLTYFVLPNKYLCLDIFMIGMSILIMKTDNLMTKHNTEVLNDYYSLQEIKYKIEEYSLIKDEQINYIKLWEEYLVYATAFGIPIPIVNKLKSTYKEDEDLAYLAKCENLYYLSKAYLEVMWDMEFKEKKKLEIF